MDIIIHLVVYLLVFYIAMAVVGFRLGIVDRWARKHEPAPPTKHTNPLLLIVLLPLTLYILAGTLLFALLATLEVLTQPLFEPDRFRVIHWHRLSSALTLTFPIMWPLVAIMVLMVLAFALAWRVLRFTYKWLLKTIIYPIVHWTWPLLRSIWLRIVREIRYIWETIAGTTDRVWERARSLMRS